MPTHEDALVSERFSEVNNGRSAPTRTSPPSVTCAQPCVQKRTAVCTAGSLMSCVAIERLNNKAILRTSRHQG